MCQQLVVGKQAGSRTPVYQKILMIVNKQNSNRKICEAFYELPGSKSRLFMGCQATGLNHLTKPLKMGLHLTNRCVNFDKFRVHGIDLSNVRWVIPGLPGRSGLLKEAG